MSCLATGALTGADAAAVRHRACAAASVTPREERRHGPGRRHDDVTHAWLRTMPTTNLLIVSVVVWFSAILVVWAVCALRRIPMDAQVLGIVSLAAVGQTLAAVLQYKALRDTWKPAGTYQQDR